MAHLVSSTPEKSDITEAATEAIWSLWPGPPSEADVVAWRSMSLENRAKALRRLRAIRDYEAAGRRGGAAAAGAAGVGLSRFTVMLREFLASPGLSVLVPQSVRRRPRAFSPPPGIVEEAGRAVRLEPEASVESIAAGLHERFGAPSLSWIRRLVTAERAALEAEGLGGGDGFGARTVIDVTALALPVLIEESGGAADPTIEWAVGAFVIDAATGWIAGHAVDLPPVGMKQYARAAGQAAQRLRGLNPLLGDRCDPVLSTTAITGDVVEEMRSIAHLSGIAGLEVVHDARTGGAELMKLLGGRLGVVRLHPRFAGEGFQGRVGREEALARSGRVPMAIDQARGIVDAGVAAYNAGRLEKVERAAVHPVEVAERLDEVFARWR